MESGLPGRVRRMRWLRRTEAANRAVTETPTVIDAAQQPLREQVGAQRYDVVVAMMRELGRDITSWARTTSPTVKCRGYPVLSGEWPMGGPPLIASAEVSLDDEGLAL